MESYTALNALGRMLMPTSLKITLKLIKKYVEVRRCREKRNPKCSVGQKSNC